MNTAPVRICMAMEEGPIIRSLKLVLSTLCGDKVAYTDGVDGADLVIFSDVREIERSYSKERQYAHLDMTPGGSKKHLPENCTRVGVLNAVAELVALIGKTHENLVPVSEEPPAHVEALVMAPIRPDALRILVIDDAPKHIESAHRGLAGHHLTTVMGYEDAMETLAREKFDVVLTDLHLPMSSKTLGDRFNLGELVNYGMLLMVESARQGAKFVAIVTDLNHHADPFSAAFDHFSQFPVQIEGAKVLMMHAPMNGDGTKDWAAALERLMK